MKKQIFQLLVFLILSVNYTEAYTIPQFSDSRTDTLSEGQYREAIYLGTDRKLYFAGEKVWFKVYNYNPDNRCASGLSKVVFVELLDRSNNPVIQTSIEADNASGSGSFTLPESMESGNYLLRAYTSWMLNYPPELFFYTTISVINPFTGIDKLKAGPEPRGSDHKADGPGYNIPPEGMNAGSKDQGITISTQSNYFSTRKKVRIDVSAHDREGKPLKANLYLSVCKSCLADINENILTYKDPGEGYKADTAFAITHLPDIEGEIISGVIKSTTTGETLKNKDISLSFVGKTSLCQFGKTNDRGEFKFIVKDIFGLKEMVIELSDNSDDYYVELDPRYTNIFCENTLPDLYIDTSRINLLNQAIISKQVNSLYEAELNKNQEIVNYPDPVDFFNKPARTISMSDYIELKDVNEIIRELISEIRIEKRNEEYILKVANSNPYEQFENASLVLVDGVPVYDIKSLLSSRASEIERIEIVTSRYFYHDCIFEGIISFITKTGGMDIFRLNNSVYRRIYEGCQVRNNFCSPDYSHPFPGEAHLPDFRNLLYWNPDLKTNAEGVSACEFYTSDEPGDYTIVVEGITEDGIRLFGTAGLTVK